MTEPQGTVFGLKAAEEIAKTVREVSRRMRNELPHRSRYQQSPGGAGGGHTIWFVINNVLCPLTDYVTETTLVVTPEYYTGECDDVPPGGNDDGTYNIYDYCGEFVGLTRDDLIGTKGKATYSKPLAGNCIPLWFVDFLCAQPQC
jgi:hypothetical protein